VPRFREEVQRHRIARSGWNGSREVLLLQPRSGEASYQDRDREALAVGDKIGHYGVVCSLGAGGMGEVYRAPDTTLQRGVAFKVLPATFLRDPERMARFQHEGAGSIAMWSSYFTWTLT